MSETLVYLVWVVCSSVLMTVFLAALIYYTIGKFRNLNIG